MPRNDPVPDNDYLFERVCHTVQRVSFLQALLFIGNGKRRLHIIFLAAFTCNKVYFEPGADALSGFVPVILFHNAHINVEITILQLVVNDVLHDVVFLLLAEIQPCISKSNIAEIVFERRANVFSALDIIALRL